MLVSLKLSADFRGVVREGESATYFSRPPYPRNSRIDSEKRTLAATLVRVYAGLWKRPTEKPLLGTSVYKPAAGHYNSGKCFVLIFGYSPSVEGVGS
jgi:hypothetical protein